MWPIFKKMRTKSVFDKLEIEMKNFFPLGRFVSWDVLSLGTFCPSDILSLGRFVSWDVLSLGHFVPGTLSLGTFCLGTFCPLRRFVLGHFFCAPRLSLYAPHKSCDTRCVTLGLGMSWPQRQSHIWIGIRTIVRMRVLAISACKKLDMNRQKKHFDYRYKDPFGVTYIWKTAILQNATAFSQVFSVHLHIKTGIKKKICTW